MIYVIMGPTACGKTKAANLIASKLNCPIINADAFQIYQEMNIGTNKIKEDDPLFNHYYLLNIRKPNETYSVKEYQDDFRNTLKEVYKDNVVVVGGTGLYIRAALYDYNFPTENEEENDFSSFNNEELYNKLVKLDKKAADTIHPNNRKRVIRAINFALKNKMTKSENIDEQSHKLFYPNNDVRFLFINPNREELYSRINDRVDEMVIEGLFNEVEMLLKENKLSQTSKQGIGYKEVISYLSNEINKEECIELIKKRTRNYAKRQVTFFKNQFEYEEFDSCDSLVNEVLSNE